MPLQTYLVDVYALKNDGRDIHLGGGCFKASCQANAEEMAAQEFAPHLINSPSELGFMTDTPERGDHPKPLHAIRKQCAERAMRDIDTAIPFND